MSTFDENGFLEGKMQKWVTDHRKRHSALFSGSLRLNRECHRFLNARTVDLGSELQITTSVLFARMLELYQAILVVITWGMAAPARILFRAFLEAFFHFSAIHRDSEYLNEYLNQFHLQRKKMVNKIRNSTSPLLEGMRQPITEELLAEIKQILEEEGVQKISIADVANKAGLHEIYLTAYTILSRTVHTSASDLESHIDYNDEQGTIKGFKYGPSDEETTRVLCLSGMVMAEVLEQISSVFGEDRREMCSKLKNSFESLLREKTGHDAA